MPDSGKSVGCTCFALRKLTRTVTRLYDQHLAGAGIRTTQFSLLKWVSYAPLPIAELARKMNAERTTLTRNLKPLIDAGWITLKPGNDARQRIATITPAGRRTIEAASRAWRCAQAKLEGALGIAAVRELHQRIDSALLQLNPLLERTPDGLDD